MSTRASLRTASLVVLALLLVVVPLSAAESQGIDILDLLHETGATLEWDEFTRTGVLWQGLDSIGFAPGDDIAVLDFSELIRIEPIVYDRGRLLVPEPTFELLADRLGRSGESARLRPLRAIVIDAGHGGKDPGTNRTVTENGRLVTHMEKDIVLDLAKRVRTELEARIAGPAIVLTRDSDVFLELTERSEIANNLRQNPLDNILFVSLHVNASVDTWTDARGVEVYYLPPSQRRQVLDEDMAASLQPEVAAIVNSLKEDEFTVESFLMGKTVLDAIAERLPETPIERGVRVANFHVVREPRMPSILIETGFINNRTDLELLTTSPYRQRLAVAIASGIAEYAKDFESLR